MLCIINSVLTQDTVYAIKFIHRDLLIMDFFSFNALIWLGIVFCLTQSAMFSGLNLALLSISRLRLEVEAGSGNHAAVRILRLREDSNFLLTTILWGNVSINVLLTLLSNSVMVGITAFLFSTVIITIMGEILPQAYFSRHAMRFGSLLSPVLQFYQYILYPVAKPSALVLDKWLGAENINYFRERELSSVIRKHIESGESDIDKLEGIGAMNFLKLDDIVVNREGEKIDPDSIISLPTRSGEPVFPSYKYSAKDPFLQAVNKSGKKWLIIVNESNQPVMVLNANAFLRKTIFAVQEIDPYRYCHLPIIVTDPETLLGSAAANLEVYPESEKDNVIDHDLIVLWGESKRIITGSDILGRLFQGIALRQSVEGQLQK